MKSTLTGTRWCCPTLDSHLSLPLPIYFLPPALSLLLIPLLIHCPSNVLKFSNFQTTIRLNGSATARSPIGLRCLDRVSRAPSHCASRPLRKGPNSSRGHRRDGRRRQDGDPACVWPRRDPARAEIPPAPNQVSTRAIHLSSWHIVFLDCGKYRRR